jgi:hypothetical protein
MRRRDEEIALHRMQMADLAALKEREGEEMRARFAQEGRLMAEERNALQDKCLKVEQEVDERNEKIL